MKVIRYAQFYIMSTGYVEGTIPPVFRDEHKEPIEKLGSDGVLVLDGRLSCANKHKAAVKRAKQIGAIGYRLVWGRGFSEVIGRSELYLIDLGAC